MGFFNKVGLTGRITKPETIITLQRLIGILQGHKREVVLSTEIAPVLNNDAGHEVVARRKLAELCELVIVVGGDGSMLSAARDLCATEVPVLGVNRGRLGFLTDVSPHDLEAKIAEILNGQYHIEQRFLLDVEVKRDGESVMSGSAFNDVVLSSGEATRMFEFESYVDDVFVNSQRADGLIVSTPTGSTAYALSAGGSIMHPSLDAIMMVPMFPHKLSSRPLVVSGSSEIKLVVQTRDNMKPVVSCDGHNILLTEPSDKIYIRKKRSKLMMLHPLDHDFYAACRDKLGWG